MRHVKMGTGGLVVRKQPLLVWEETQLYEQVLSTSDGYVQGDWLGFAPGGAYWRVVVRRQGNEDPVALLHLFAGRKDFGLLRTVGEALFKSVMGYT